MENSFARLFGAYMKKSGKIILRGCFAVYTFAVAMPWKVNLAARLRGCHALKGKSRCAVARLGVSNWIPLGYPLPMSVFIAKPQNQLVVRTYKLHISSVIFYIYSQGCKIGNIRNRIHSGQVGVPSLVRQLKTGMCEPRLFSGTLGSSNPFYGYIGLAPV